MKTLSGILLFLAFAFNLNAQQSTFIHYEGNGKVILTDGKVLEGIVEYALTYPGTVRITIGDDREKYKAKEVKEFFVQDKHYFALKFSGEITVGSDLSFAYIISPDSARLKLYKNETQPIVGSGDQVPVTVSYYVGLPDSKDEVLPLGHLSLNPSKKLSKFYESCPSLVAKINNKEKGFSYGMITSDENRLTVIEKLNTEFASCK